MNEELNAEAIELALYKRQLHIIRNVSAELHKLDNLKSKLGNILRILDAEFGIKHCMILLPDDSHSYLSVFASHGYPETESKVAFGKGIVGMAAERKIPINLTGLRHKTLYLESFYPGDGTQETLPGLPDAQSQIAIPLLSNNELVSVLLAESTTVSVFSLENERFLKMLSPQIAVSIQNAVLFDTMEEKIRSRTQELEEINQTKDKLFSIVSHDLRGPVTSFQSITQLLKHYASKGDSTKIEGLSSKIEQSVQGLNFLLDNLLNWSLSQERQISCQFEPIEMRTFMQESLSIYHESFTSKNIGVLISIEDDTKAMADRNTLSVIFRNLLSNAIKFTRRNGSIVVSGKSDGKTVSIAVEDNGVGIPDETLRHLFTHNRISTIGTEKERGTGLGLVLVQEFVQMNRGNISVQSTSQKGTKFTLTLPAAL